MPHSPWSPSIHGQAGVNSAARQELSQRRNYPAASAPRSAGARHNSVILYPRTLQLSAVQTQVQSRSNPPRSNLPRSNLPSTRHGSRQLKQGRNFRLSDAIASGTATHSNGNSSSAGSVHDSIDRKPAAVTKRVMAAPVTGELLWSPSRGRVAVAMAPTTLSSANSGPRAVPPVWSAVNKSPWLSATAATTASPKKPARPGAKVAGRLVRGRRPSFQYFKSTNNYQLPEMVKAYGKSALGTESSQSFRTAGKGTSKGFAPTKVQIIPTRFGGIAIQRLRDPIKNGGTGVVSRPQATNSKGKALQNQI